MPFQDLIKTLRRTERELLKQLAGVREAISSLELGGAVSPSMPTRDAGARKRRRISKAGRARISAAQKARWARQKAGKV
jgi:hypothetical protein